MKADWNDAPEYIRTYPRKMNTTAWVIPGLIGAVIVLGALQVAGSAFLKGTTQSIAERRIQPKPVPVAKITRAEPIEAKDWEKVVEEVAARGATRPSGSGLPKSEEALTPHTKQTVFTDANYMPRGADNVLRLKESTQAVEPLNPPANKGVTVVGERTSMKDRACWPHKEGSLERRNCRSRVGLNYRD